MWDGFSGSECGALFRCGYEGAGGGGARPPENLVCVCPLALTEGADDMGQERGVREGSAWAGVGKSARGRAGGYLDDHISCGCIRSYGAEKRGGRAASFISAGGGQARTEVYLESPWIGLVAIRVGVGHGQAAFAKPVFSLHHDQPLFVFSVLSMSRSVRLADDPAPPPRQPVATGTTIRRAKTLTRPERSVAPVPLINPPSSLAPTASGWIPGTGIGSGFDPWRVFSLIVTFWAPSFLLTSLGGLTDKNMIQAWREKIALCFIILLLCLAVAFITVGTQMVLCPSTESTTSDRYSTLGSVAGTLSVQGIVFNVTAALSPQTVNLASLTQQEPGQDITPYFTRSASQYTACNGLTFHVATDNPCTTPCPLGPLNTSSTFTQLNIQETSQLLGYDWSQVASLSNYFVVDGAVLNMNPYMQLHPSPISADPVDLAIRSVLQSNNTGGKDATMLFYNNPSTKSAVPCLTQRYYAGNIDKMTPGCFVSSLFLYVGLIVILSLVLVRFAMACVFNWFLSAKLAGPPDSTDLNRSAISPAVMPEGANISIDNKTGMAPWAGPGGSKKLAALRKTPGARAVAPVSPQESSQVMSLAQIGTELFAVCLVTCYSEGEDSMRSTLDAISQTTYSDHRKLIFVVADGMITGAGEKRSTPDICVSLLEADPRFGNPAPMSYLAVGSGAKRENRAMVYAGHYSTFF